MEKSDKFSLFLPDDSDIIEISKLSYNFEKIDDVLSLIMVILGYGGEITYEVNNIDIGKPFANDTSLHDDNMYIAQIDVAFKLMANGVRIIEKNVNTDVKIYPFGVEGSWSSKTGIPIMLCLLYNYKTKEYSFTGLWKYSMDEYNHPTVDGTVITFPLGEFEMDVLGKTGKLNDIQFYTPIEYDSSGIIDIEIAQEDDK